MSNEVENVLVMVMVRVTNLYWDVSLFLDPRLVFWYWQCVRNLIRIVRVGVKQSQTADRDQSIVRVRVRVCSDGTSMRNKSWLGNVTLVQTVSPMPYSHDSHEG